jgi:hypothetical protein
LTKQPYPSSLVEFIEMDDISRKKLKQFENDFEKDNF